MITGFLCYATKQDSEFYHLLSNYLNAISSDEEFPVALQQILFNRLLSPDKKIFFNQEGKEASLEDYFKDIYGETVEIIRIDIEKLDQESIDKISSVISGQQLTDFVEMTKELPVATVVIKKGDSLAKVPIISSKYEGSSNAFAVSSLSEDDLYPIFINTKLKTRSLFETISTIAHEVDHAVHNVANPLGDKYFHLEGDLDRRSEVTNYLFRGKSYSLEAIRELSDLNLDNYSNLLDSHFEKMKLLKSAIAEMEGERAASRFLRTFSTGIKDRDQEELAAKIEFFVQSEFLNRLYSIDHEGYLPYSLGNMLGEAIEEEYGLSELLRIINEVPMEMNRTVFQDALLEGEELLLARKNLFFNMARLNYSMRDQLIVDVRDLNKGQDKSEEQELSFRDRIGDSFEKLAIFDQVIKIIPLKPGLWLETVESLHSIVNYLSEENNTFR